MGFYVVQQGLIFWVFNLCQYSDDGSDLLLQSSITTKNP